MTKKTTKFKIHTPAPQGGGGASRVGGYLGNTTQQFSVSECNDLKGLDG